VQWLLRLRPVRPLEVYFLFSRDPEFGADLGLFYNRAGLAVPTEDAYVFGWDYLALLARYGRGAYPLAVQAPAAEWVRFTEIEAQAAGSLQQYALTGRGEVLPAVTPEVAGAAVWRLGSGDCRPQGPEGWVVIWPVLPDLALRLEVGPEGVDLAYDAAGVRKYGVEFLLSFAWLYINAFLREARRVDDTLPRLSQYF
jgi:hypothetical protein